MINIAEGNSSAYDGIQCSLSCPQGFSQSGSIYCDDGNWVNSLVCVDQNYLNYCHSGSDCSGNGVTTDQNRQDGRGRGAATVYGTLSQGS